jgi:hypothetical protein
MELWKKFKTEHPTSNNQQPTSNQGKVEEEDRRDFAKP